MKSNQLINPEINEGRNFLKNNSVNIIESLTDAVIMTDLQFRILSWNNAAVTLYGWKPNEVIGKNVTKVLKTNYVSFHRENLKKSLLDSGSWNGDIIQTKRDGGKIYISSSVTILHDRTGVPKQIIAINRDNNEHKHAEDALEYKSEINKVLSCKCTLQRMFKKVAHLTSIFMADWCSIDMVTDTGMVKLAALAHHDPEKIKHAIILHNKYLLDPSAKGIHEAIKSGKPQFYPSETQKLVNNPKSPSSNSISSAIIVPISVTKKPIGALSFVLSRGSRHFTSYDLAVAKQVADRISTFIENIQLYQQKKEEKDRLTTLLASVPGIVWEIYGHPMHSDQKIVFVSKYIEHILGYKAEEFINGSRTWLSIVHPEYQELMKNESIALFEKGTGGTNRFKVVKKDGSFLWVESQTTLIKDKHGKPAGMRGVLMDVSKYMLLETKKDEFLGIASHELRTPLTSIKGYIQILDRLVDSGAPREDIKRFLKRTDIYTDKLNGLISDLLDVSKIHAGKLVMHVEKFCVDEMVRESIESIQPISPNHCINFTGKTERLIYGDKLRLEQVVTNLLSNAIKYSPKANKIDVLTRSLNNSVQISVRDYGIGIPKNKQSHLFERFYRIEDSEMKFSGMGIGLYICNEIVKRHNGNISVTSDGKNGTTFSVSLPVS